MKKLLFFGICVTVAMGLMAACHSFDLQIDQTDDFSDSMAETSEGIDVDTTNDTSDKSNKDLYLLAEQHYFNKEWKNAISVAEQITDRSSIYYEKAQNIIICCQQELKILQANQTLLQAQDAFTSGNWQEVINICNTITESVPNTTVADSAITLATQAQGKIDEEKRTALALLMEKLKKAYSNNEWDNAKALASEIIKQYPAYTNEIVTALETYNNADKKITDQKNKDLAKKVEKLNTDRDDVENVMWYYPSSTPEYINSYSVAYLYMGQRDNGTPWLRWKVIYVGQNWVFFEKLIINVDGEIFTKNFSYNSVERDNNSKNLWEYIDISPSSSDLDIIRKIITSKKTVIRFKGDSKQSDYTVTKAQKQGIKDVLEAYEYIVNASEVCQHSQGTLIATIPLSCTTDHIKIYECKKCKNLYFNTIEKSEGHSLTTETIREVSCQVTGELKHTCTICGESKTETVPQNHNYEKKLTKKATCEMKGSYTYNCSKCNDKYSESIPALGHSMSSATCQNPAKCSRCGKVSAEALGHIWTLNWSGTEIECTRCQKDYQPNISFWATGLPYTCHHWSEGPITITGVSCGSGTKARIDQNGEIYISANVWFHTAGGTGLDAFFSVSIYNSKGELVAHEDLVIVSRGGGSMYADLPDNDTYCVKISCKCCEQG